MKLKTNRWTCHARTCRNPETITVAASGVIEPGPHSNMEGQMAVYANKQWAVTDFGMEAVEPLPTYEIDAERLGETTDRAGVPLYDWPVHMAEKTWVDIALFIEAFEVALRKHAGAYGEELDREILEASYAFARREATRR